mmetsp:Transcript_15989/g.19412  ORF Transcript_15989/g.19412 Transcript_15989/m.19412 type:complete len:131 (+) Transcript_15989:1-393(+)
MKEFSPQNVHFYVRVVELERLKKLHKIDKLLIKALKKGLKEETEARQNILREIAEDIVNEFIVEDSPNQINIPASIRNEIVEAHNKGEYDYAMFRKARLCVYNLMGSDTFQRFIGTPDFDKIMDNVGVYR